MGLNFSESLEKITCPALIICGEKDSANRKSAVEMANRMENAELCFMRGVGHEVNVEAPEQLAEVLQRFYAKER